MGYTTDFDGADIAGPRDPNLPHSECHWRPLEPAGIGFGWDGCEKFTGQRGWLAYLIENFLSPWGYRLDGAVTWQGEDEDDRGVIVVEANQVSVLGFRRPCPESEPSHSRYWPPERQARLLAGRGAGADEVALAIGIELRTIVGTVTRAARIYQRALLMGGARLTWGQAIRLGRGARPD